MTDRPWKKWERVCAALISGTRYPFNSGGKVDVESVAICGQCKEVTTLPLIELTRLAGTIEAVAHAKGKLGVVFARHKAGRGNTSRGVVVMTMDTFARLINNKAGFDEDVVDSAAPPT